MKVTKKITTQEIENTEVVCEITQAEFSNLCAEKAAEHIMKFMGNEFDPDKFQASLSLTSILAELFSDIDDAMFGKETPKTTKTKEE